MTLLYLLMLLLPHWPYSLHPWPHGRDLMLRLPKLLLHHLHQQVLRVQESGVSQELTTCSPQSS